MLSQDIKLMSNSFKKYAWFMMLLGVAFIYAYFQDKKPEILNVHVFAIVSTYADTNFFLISKTNLMDEIGVSLFLFGLFILVFSKEKEEKLIFNDYRFKAFILSGKTTLLVWIVCYFLFFGYVIFPISILAFPSFLIIYYSIFRYSIYKDSV